MGKHSNVLKTLRAIALEHAAHGSPDLASMARDLGRVVHQDGAAPASRLIPLHSRQRGLKRWLLAERSKPAISVLVMAWPANHRTPLYDHAGLWGLELTLHGALEVQSYARDPVSGDLRPHGRDWLGPGDGTWFEGDPDQAHRCRNLSRHDTALTLHVYGESLAECVARQQMKPAGGRIAQPQRGALAGCLSR
jgi:predicted metal-dependent enzyme (double-stranded beta helix superfamily)